MMIEKEFKLSRCFMRWLICTCMIVVSILSLSEMGYSEVKKGARIGKYFLFLGIGDWSYRRTSVFLEDYDFIGGWSYAKIVWYGKVLPFGIYASGTFAYSNQSKPWENNYVIGFGVEKYVFEDIEKLSGLFKNIRFYFEYLKIGYTRDKAEEWVPTYDIRVGFDFYKDYGIGKDKVNKLFWGEFWGNFAWQKTNFYIKDYKSITAGMNVKIGLRLIKGGQFSLMPYLVGELSWVSRHDFFWQNRGFIGTGLRIMPFAKANSELGNRFKIFAEYFFTVQYLKDQPPGEVPGYDVRVGINYSIGLWK